MQDCSTISYDTQDEIDGRFIYLWYDMRLRKKLIPILVANPYSQSCKNIQQVDLSDTPDTVDTIINS